MNDSLTTIIALVAVAIGLALVPDTRVAFVLQGAGVGALIGTAVAERAKSRHPQRDHAPIVMRWTLLIAGVSIGFVVIDSVIGGVR